MKHPSPLIALYAAFLLLALGNCTPSLKNRPEAQIKPLLETDEIAPLTDTQQNIIRLVIQSLYIVLDSSAPSEEAVREFESKMKAWEKFSPMSKYERLAIYSSMDQTAPLTVFIKVLEMNPDPAFVKTLILENRTFKAARHGAHAADWWVFDPATENPGELCEIMFLNIVQDEAIAYLDTYRGPLFAAGYRVKLKRIEGEWEVVMREVLWES
jgi:hypothetical protein